MRKERFDVGLVEAADGSAEVAGDFDRTALAHDGFGFFAAERADHAAHPFVAAAAGKDGLGLVGDERFFLPEEAAVDLFGRQRQKFFALDGVDEHLQPLPGFGIEILGELASAFGRHLLDHDTADAAVVAREHDLGVDLFARREVVRHDFGEGGAFKRHDTLIGLLIGGTAGLIENERAAAAARAVDEVGQGGIDVDLARIVAHGDGNAEDETFADFGYDELDGTVARDLKEHRAVEFQSSRSEQSGGGDFGRQTADGDGQMLVFDRTVEFCVQRHGFAAHGGTPEQKFLKSVHI